MNNILIKIEFMFTSVSLIDNIIIVVYNYNISHVVNINN